jgi:hypothetical protein
MKTKTFLISTEGIAQRLFGWTTALARAVVAGAAVAIA